MKKLLILFVIVMMAFSMAACEDDPPEVNKQISNDLSLYTDYDFSANAIEKGAEYSFGLDEWNLYVATAISDKLIQIVRWDKSSSDEPNYEKDEEIGVFSIDDPATGFIWLDDSHTAFYINLKDTDKDAIKYGESVAFSQLVTSGDRNKGANYSSSLTSYIYEYSDQYWYRAIPLSGTILKVEAWRCYDGFLWDTWVYSYDVFVINKEKTTSDFAWTDDECTSFSITMEDTENGGWDGKKLIYFLVDGDIQTPSQDGDEGSSGAVPTLPPTTGENIINIIVECDENLIFSQYDLTIYLDDVYQTELKHGKNGAYTFNLDDGTYKLTLCRTDDSSVRGEVQFAITDSTNITYNVHCYSGNVEVTQKHFEIMRPLADNETKVPDDGSNYVGKIYQSVRDSLTSVGFTNIKYEILYDIVWGWTSEGEIESVSIGGIKDFSAGDIFAKDIEVVITYHMWEEADPSRIKMIKNAADYEGMHYTEVKKIFEELGFSNVVLEDIETADTTYNDGEVCRITVDYEHFDAGDTFKPDDKVLIKYYIVEPVATEGTVNSSPVYYSTNDYETAKKGNTGVFSYKNKSGAYDVYWIIDFDKGYVYFFTEGNGEDYCDKVKISSGALNDCMTITWNLDGEKTNWYLHFKYVNSPVTLVVNDHLGLTIEFTTTDLADALALRDTKRIQNS